MAMNTAASQRRYQDLHKDAPYHDGTFKRWAKEASLDFPFHAEDGVTIYVADFDENPDDQFLTADDEEGGEPVGNEA